MVGKDKIAWCLKRREGLELIEPNDNVSRAYFMKAEDSLSAMSKVDSRDWMIATAYYTFYFSLYAILMHIGVKSRIHSCTIAFMEEYLSGYFSKQDLDLLKASKDARIDAQYYIDRHVPDEVLDGILDKAAPFLVRCRSVVFSIGERETSVIRERIGLIY